LQITAVRWLSPSDLKVSNYPYHALVLFATTKSLIKKHFYAFQLNIGFVPLPDNFGNSSFRYYQMWKIATFGPASVSANFYTESVKIGQPVKKPGVEVTTYTDSIELSFICFFA